MTASVHGTAFAIDDTLLGTPPRDSDYDPYAASHRDAEAAIEDLDRAIGRPLERQGLERPGRSL